MRFSIREWFKWVETSCAFTVEGLAFERVATKTASDIDQKKRVAPLLMLFELSCIDGPRYSSVGRAGCRHRHLARQGRADTESGPSLRCFDLLTPSVQGSPITGVRV